MKKNFFKKLSFVLALAMIVSVIAPAAGVLASTSPALNSAKRYLLLGEASSEFDFNINNKPASYKGAKYAWSSSNEAVATVDKSGLTTAASIGTTEIKVVVKKADGKTATFKATVIVKDNIAELSSVYMQTKDAPALDKLQVATNYDFGRTYVTKSGSTTKTTAVTKWFVDSDKATIDKMGVFNATEAGTYKITAMAFQSTAKYQAWAALKDATATTNVLATKTIEVKVVVGIASVKLLSPSKLEVVFDSSVKDVVKAASDLKVDVKLTDTLKTMVPVKSLDSISSDGKTVVFSTYDNLVNDKTYYVSAAGATKELLAQIGTPVSISLQDQVIAAGTSTEVAYQLLDQYGVDVKSAYGVNVTKNSSVAFDTGKAGYLTLGNDVVSFVEYNYTIQNSDGTSKLISTGTHTVKGVAATTTTSFDFVVSTLAPTFTETTKTVKVGDNSQTIYGRAKKSDDTYTNYAIYKFVSMNEGILVIDQATNKLYPNAAGTALVKVVDKTNSDALVTYINVEVTAAAAVQGLKASTSNLILSNSIAGVGQESGTVTIKSVDQYNTEANASIAESYVVNTNKTTDIATISVSGSAITFTAVPAKTGSFNYFVKDANGKTTTFNVTVAAPSTLNAYSITADQASIDTYIANADTTNTVNFTVYGVDAAGVKKELVNNLVTPSGVAVTYSITDVDGTVLVNNATFTGAASYSVNDADGTAEKTGTYTFTISIGGVKYAKTFTVTNTRIAPVATVNAISTTAVSGSAVTTAINNMITVKIGDTAKTVSAVKFISTNSTVVANDGLSFLTSGTVTLYVTKVTVTTDDGVAKDVDINRTFTVTVQ